MPDSVLNILVDAAKGRQEVEALNADLTETGKVSTTSGASASAALNTVERASATALSSTQQMLLRQQQLALQVTQANAAIKAETVSLDLMQRVSAQNADAAAILSSKIVESEKAIVAAVEAKKAATVESQALSAALNNTSEAAGLSASQILRTGGAIDKLALGVNTGARQLSVLASAFSAASIPQLALIIVVSLLIGELVKLASAKETHVELNDKLIAQDIVMAQTGETAAERASKQKVVQGDMIAILALLIDHSQKYSKAIEDQKNAQTELATAQIQQQTSAMNAASATGGLAENMGNLFVPSVKSASESVAEYTEKMQKEQAELDKNIESMVKFANETGKANDVIIRQAQEMGADADTIKRLSDALNSATRAQQQWQSALDSQTIPDVNLRNTVEGEAQARKQLIERINGQVSAGKSLRDVVEANKAALEAELKAIQAGIDLDVAAGRVKGTHAAMQAELTKRIAEGGDGLEKYLAVVRASDEAHKHWTSTVDKAASAAKALAVVTSELQKQLEQAQAKEDGKTFEAQRQSVVAAIAAKRTELQIKGQLTQENLQLLAQIEFAQLQRIANEHVKAIEEANARIAAINAKAIVDEYDRHRAAITTQTEEDRKAFVALGLDEVEIYLLVIRAKQGREDEFQRWFIERNKKTAEELSKVAIDMSNHLAVERAREEEDTLKKSLDRQLKLREQEEDRERALAKQFQTPDHTPNMGIIEQAERSMRRLGVTTNDVSQIFGRAARNEADFNKQLETLDEYAKGDPLGGLRDSFLQIIDIQNLATATAGSFANALQSAFTQSIAEGKNFAEVFGKTLLAGILSAIGQQAIAEGTYHILAGTAKLFNPFTAAQGAQEIAAGAALVAFGSALAAGASLLNNSMQKSGAAGASSGSASAGSDNSTTTQPRVTQPTFVNVGGSQTQTALAGRQHHDFSKIGWTDPNKQMVLHLDRQGTRDFLEGNKVVMAGNVGQHRQALRRGMGLQPAG